jgi:hypothetical protein
VTNYTLDQELARNFASHYEDSLEAHFWRFHRAHPEVYAAIVQLAREWRSRGRARWSINGAFEVLRWQRHLAGLPDEREGFKLNNNYRSRYARLITDQESDLSDVFEMRALK